MQYNTGVGGIVNTTQTLGHASSCPSTGYPNTTWANVSSSTSKTNKLVLGNTTIDGDAGKITFKTVDGNIEFDIKNEHKIIPMH